MGIEISIRCDCESPQMELALMRAMLRDSHDRSHLGNERSAAMKIADELDGATRSGKEIDSPEGARYITISHTRAMHMAAALRGYYKVGDA